MFISVFTRGFHIPIILPLKASSNHDKRSYVKNWFSISFWRNVGLIFILCKCLEKYQIFNKTLGKNVKVSIFNFLITWKSGKCYILTISLKTHFDNINISLKRENLNWENLTFLIQKDRMNVAKYLFLRK